MPNIIGQMTANWISRDKVVSIIDIYVLHVANKILKLFAPFNVKRIPLSTCFSEIIKISINPQRLVSVEFFCDNWKLIQVECSLLYFKKPSIVIVCL